MADLVVVAANLHNESRATDEVRKWSRAHTFPASRFDIGLMCESQKRRKALKRMPGHVYHTGPAGRGGNDAGREVGVLLANRLPDLGGGSFFLSAAFPKAPKVGKERWGQVRVTKVKGREIAAVCLHPVASPDALRNGKNTPLTRRHKRAIKWANQTIRYHRKLGRDVVFGGDVNVRDGWAGAQQLKKVLARHRMSSYWQGLDLIAWTPGLVVKRANTHQIGSNHPALRVELNIRKAKK